MRSGILMVALASALMSTSTAVAQTLFAWPDTAVDVSSYSSVEECVSAVSRVREATTSQEVIVHGVWRDTMPYDRLEDTLPLLPPVGETARRCLRSFVDAEAVRVEDFIFLVPLYLIAGWDDKAMALTERRLAAVAPDKERELVAVIDTIVEIFGGTSWNNGLKVQPPRPAAVEDILNRYLQRVSDRTKWVPIYWKQLGLAGRADTASIEKYASRLVALVESLSQSERDRLLDEWEGLSELVENEDAIAHHLSGMTEFIYGRQKLYDHLRQSTEAYVRNARDAWARATGQPPETYWAGMPIGERAPEIEADIWLGCEGSCTNRPTPGRVSLVVFLSHARCRGAVSSPFNNNGMAGDCAGVLIPLRRLTERFPDVETTVVTNTSGYFKYLKESVTLENEARLVRQWLDSFGLRAPLAIVDTEIWHLPNYDGRRIDKKPEIVNKYEFGKTWQFRISDKAFLVDEDGIIVYSMPLSRMTELDFGERIEVLLERHRLQP